MPMQMPMQMPMPMPQMNFRGKKRDSPGEGIELVSLNSLGRAPIGRTTRKRTSSKSSSSKGIEMIEFNKGRKRKTTSSGRRSSRKGRKVSNKPYDEVLSLTETDSIDKRGSLYVSSPSKTTSSSPFQNLKSSPSSSTKRRTSLRELEESLSLSPLTGSPGRASTKRRGG